MGTCCYSYNPPKKKQEHQQIIFCRSFCSGISGRFFPPKKPFAVWFFAPPPEWQWPTDSIGGLHRSTFFLIPLTLQISLVKTNLTAGLAKEKIGLDLDDPYLDLLEMSMFTAFWWDERANILQTWKIISAGKKKAWIMGRPTLTPSCSLLKQTSCLMAKNINHVLVRDPYQLYKIFICHCLRDSFPIHTGDAPKLRWERRGTGYPRLGVYKTPGWVKLL